jgi:hypothetical protein
VLARQQVRRTNSLSNADPGTTGLAAGSTLQRMRPRIEPVLARQLLRSWHAGSAPPDRLDAPQLAIAAGGGVGCPPVQARVRQVFDRNPSPCVAVPPRLAHAMQAMDSSAAGIFNFASAEVQR